MSWTDIFRNVKCDEIRNLRSVALSHGCNPNEVIIIGIQDEREMRMGLYNDLICALYGDKAIVCRGTVDPGPYWADPDRRKKKGWEQGEAHVCLGLHKNVYEIMSNYHGSPGLKQVGPITIWRDYNANFEQDAKEGVKSGLFQIHIHVGLGDVIGLWSAGCQNILGREKINEFVSFIKDNSPGYKTNKKFRFDYLLINRKEIMFKELMDDAI